MMGDCKRRKGSGQRSRVGTLVNLLQRGLPLKVRFATNMISKMHFSLFFGITFVRKCRENMSIEVLFKKICKRS